MELRVNNRSFTIPAQWREDSLLFVLREHLGLVGAKFGCGDGLCGACTVLIDDVARRSCIVSAEDAAGQKIETIEGSALDLDLTAATAGDNLSNLGIQTTGATTYRSDVALTAATFPFPPPGAVFARPLPCRNQVVTWHCRSDGICLRWNLPAE